MSAAVVTPAGRRKEALKAAHLCEHRPRILMEYLPGTRDLSAVVTERGSPASDEVAGIGAAAPDAHGAGHSAEAAAAPSPAVPRSVPLIP